MLDTKETWRVNIMRRIENEIVPELSRLHEKVMSALAHAGEQLTGGVHKSSRKGNPIDLELINKLTSIYREHLVSWPQRMKEEFVRIVEDVRFESDATYNIEKLASWQKAEFLRILNKLE